MNVVGATVQVQFWMIKRERKAVNYLLKSGKQLAKIETGNERVEFASEPMRNVNQTEEISSG